MVSEERGKRGQPFASGLDHPVHRGDGLEEVAALMTGGADPWLERTVGRDGDDQGPVTHCVQLGGTEEERVDVLEVVEQRSNGDVGLLGNLASGGMDVPCLEQSDHRFDDRSSGPVAPDQAPIHLRAGL